MTIKIDIYSDIETGKWLAEIDGWPDFKRKFTYANPKFLTKYVTEYISKKMLEDMNYSDGKSLDEWKDPE